MATKPYSNALIHHTIHKIKSHWDEMRQSIHPYDAHADYIAKWISQTAYLKQLSFHNCISIALWDIVHNRFVLMLDERNVTGYDLSLYTNENGVDFSLANFHPDHIHALQLMNRCSSECMALYREDTQPDRMMLNIDALYRIADGSYIHILQQIVPVETDKNGHPFLFLSYIRDISHLKKNMSASFVFTTPHVCKLWNYNADKRDLQVIMPLTTQEKKIMQLLGEGKPSRYIAEELSLSSHTVDTHRRRLLAKTNCLDTTALSAYFHLIGLL